MQIAGSHAASWRDYWYRVTVASRSDRCRYIPLARIDSAREAARKCVVGRGGGRLADAYVDGSKSTQTLSIARLSNL